MTDSADAPEAKTPPTRYIAQLLYAEHDERPTMGAEDVAVYLAVEVDALLAEKDAKIEEAHAHLIASLEDKPGPDGKYLHLLYCNNGHGDVVPGSLSVTCNCHPILRHRQSAAEAERDAVIARDAQKDERGGTCMEQSWEAQLCEAVTHTAELLEKCRLYGPADACRASMARAVSMVPFVAAKRG